MLESAKSAIFTGNDNPIFDCTTMHYAALGVISAALLVGDALSCVEKFERLTQLKGKSKLSIIPNQR